MSTEYIDIDLSNLFIISNEINKLLLVITGGGLFSSCKKYPLVTDISSAEDMLNALFPSSVVGNNAYSRVVALADWVQTITPDSNAGVYLEQAIHIATATGASIATVGIGGIVVNMVFTIQKALLLCTTLINTIDDIIDTMRPDAEPNDDGTPSANPNAIRFLSDIFNIDFRDGPAGVECWVNQIFKEHDTKETDIFVCEILQKIYPAIVDFISNMIGTAIPGVGVFVISMISHIMKSNTGKRLAINKIINILKKSYKRIPKDTKNMIQDPILLERKMNEGYTELQKMLHDIFKYDDNKKTKQELETDEEPADETVEPDGEQQNELDDATQNGGMMGVGLTMKMASKIATKTLLPAIKGLSSLTGFNKLLGPKLRELDDVSDKVIKNSRLIAYILHKMLAFTFAILYVIRKCPVNQK